MTFAYSRKLLFLVVPACALGVACTNEGDPPVTVTSGPLTTAIATIANDLPADGCSFQVTIDNVDFAPDAASLDAIRGLLSATRQVTATVSYRLTGRTGQVECGFNTHKALPEIAVVIDAFPVD